ncbi:hypothetical protein [Mucilaginibacter rubeus]|uniref:hypothetical protein n=1 Tax=Mucilaginibacter rubeus TaxID=2027860 RepID=UPI001667D421|nr:hypothetical protein [Mucilaginibacter rubeus]GGA94753.1 hypothetical protein GCM10011500_08120 [Mucilaginibacter rubeus]
MYKVFYLDDEKADLIQPIVNKLKSTGELDVKWEKPVAFESELDSLEGILKDYNGLFLDLQLNGDQEDGTKVKYQAPPLAQTVRTLATEKKIPDIPIFLCSTDDRIKDSFKRDFTSHDLFDWTFLKNEIGDHTIKKISSIILGYQRIAANLKDFSKLLERDYASIDNRILSRFINEENPPVHEIARVIFKDIVQPTGVLINEDILAARLGIDIKESSNWEIVRDKLFIEAKYKGVFHESWDRWWSDSVSEIFSDLTRDNLAGLNAEERVALLLPIVGEKIVAAKPLKFNFSTNYWTVCVVTKQPIDPYEAFKIDMKSEPKPWQDYNYVSLFALIERLAERDGVVIHPSEVERYSVEIADL